MGKKKKHRNRKSDSQPPSKDTYSREGSNFFVKHWMRLLLAGMVVLSLVISSSGMNGPFIFDDMSNIEYNPHIRLSELSFDGLQKAALRRSRVQG